MQQKFIAHAEGTKVVTSLSVTLDLGSANAFVPYVIVFVRHALVALGR